MAEEGFARFACRSALYEQHRALGATFTDFAGWEMPLRYGSDVAEHHAVRRAAGLFDLSHMGEIAVRGSEAAQALDFALVGALSSLPVGRARYTMMCGYDGGILDDLIVYRLADDDYLVVANASNTTSVLTHLVERCAGYVAQVSDETSRWSLIGVQGPKAVEVLRALVREPFAALKYYAWMSARVAGFPVLLARTGYTGEDGFEIFAEADATELWQQLLRRGEPAGLVPAGLACRDSLRLEAGMPLYGHELTRDRTPFEAGLGRVVRLDKSGDFVGRAALARRCEDGVAATLVGLAARGRRAPRAGQAVLAHLDSGDQVGVVTSGLPSPTLGYGIAMAYVNGAPPQSGAALVVDVRGQAEPVTVVELPFYRRAKD